MLQTDMSFTHFIEGESLPVTGGEPVDVYRPATGDILARVPNGTPQDIDRAVTSGQRAFREWSRLAPEQRERVLAAIARGIEEERDSLAAIESANTGKRTDVALAEIDAAAGLFRFYAGFPSKNFGDQIPVADAGTLCYTSIEPLGVIGAITPWNYPLLIVAGKVAAALAAGCAVVAKPAPETPLTALTLARIAHERGLPSGAFNVVAGGGDTGAALARNPRIAKISFTGSTATGRKIVIAAGANGRPSTLELGGKSPNLVFDDIDLASSIDPILMGALTNSGQECCAGARVLVEEGSFDRFVDLASRRIKNMRAGTGPDAEIGPLISQPQHERVSGFVERAGEEGATIAAQGEVPDAGFYFPPTLIVDVNAEMEICREEIFGPVLTVDKFRDETEALEMANATRYGLAAGVWTSSIGRAIRLSRELQAGQVWINSFLAGDPAAPFGGSKDSGFGRELGLEGPKEFSEIKIVFISDPPA